jgi:hypothetical protein
MCVSSCYMYECMYVCSLPAYVCVIMLHVCMHVCSPPVSVYRHAYTYKCMYSMHCLRCFERLVNSASVSRFAIVFMAYSITSRWGQALTCFAHNCSCHDTGKRDSEAEREKEKNANTCFAYLENDTLPPKLVWSIPILLSSRFTKDSQLLGSVQNRSESPIDTTLFKTTQTCDSFDNSISLRNVLTATIR